MLTVDLVYFPGCPNIERTRENLSDAFARLRRAPSWLEWDAGDSATPNELRGYGSPTVLVNGRDIDPVDVSTSNKSLACRVYRLGDVTDGAPGVDLIVRAIEFASDSAGAPLISSPLVRARWRNLAFVPAVGLAAVPIGVCPFCFATYLGAFTALGLGVLLDPWILAPVTVLALLPAILALAWKAKTRHGYRPLWLGLVGALAIGVGQLLLAQPSMVWAGAAALLAAAVWNAWPRANQPNCAACIPALPTSESSAAAEARLPHQDHH